MNGKTKKMDLPPVKEYKLHLYQVSYVDDKGEAHQFIVRSVSKLEFKEGENAAEKNKALSSKNKEVDVGGAEIAKVMRSPQVNTSGMGEESTHADIFSVYPNDLEARAIPGLKTFETITAWAGIPNITVSYLGDKKVAENKLATPIRMLKDEFKPDGRLKADI